MSPRSSDPPPAPGIYEALLFVSFAAVIMGIIFLTLELGAYNWNVPG